MASSYPWANGIVDPGRRTTQRPTLPSIQTTIPAFTALQTPERHGRGRDRATTDLRQPLTVNFPNWQAHPGQGPPGHPRAPPHIDLAPTTEELEHLRNHQDSASPLVTFNHTPSAPIPIPSRRKGPSRPTTPLTAREGKDNYFPPDYPITPRKPHLPGSPRGPDQFQDDRLIHSIESSSLSQPHSPAKSLDMRLRQDSPTYTPSSPLSPTIPAPPVPSALHARANVRRASPAHNLRLSSLPRFHPANFPSSDSSSSTSPRTTSRPSSSQYSHRPLSEAQFKLQQYQRDLIATATRSSHVASSPTTGPKPNSPRLRPLGSPGPVTPMMLEGQGDYLVAGAGGANSKASSVRDGRELVEKMIQLENERRNIPGRDGRISPAVSPAGGRG